MKLIEFSSVQLAVTAGQLFGLMFANLLAGNIAFTLQSKHPHELENVKKYTNSLYYCSGIILLLVTCIGQKLYLAAPYKYKQADLSFSTSIKAAILSSAAIILLATVIYFAAQLNTNTFFRLFSSGFIESMLSVAGMLLSLIPYILTGFTRFPMMQEKSVKIASIFTFFLIISAIYAFFQDGFVSFIGSKMAKLYYLL